MSDPQIVYIVDDDVNYVQATEEIFRFAGMSVQSCSSAEELLSVLPSEPRGVVLVDLRLRGLSGLELLRDHVPRPVSLPVLVVTGFADVPKTVQLMRAGAVDVIEKPADGEGLVSRVKKALDVEASTWARGGALMECRRRLGSLTPREREVLEQLSHGKSNRETGEALGISPRTVEVHRGRIMGKMKADSMTGLVRDLVQFGLHGDRSLWQAD
jgi:two-component system response regulator FixJ